MLCWSVRVLLVVGLLTAATQESQEQQKEEKEVSDKLGAGRGPPQNVTVTPEVTSLNVSWDPPDEPPSYYLAQVDSESYETNQTSVVILDLEPCTYYVITLTSVYDDEEYVTTSTGSTSSPVPPPPLSCWFTDITQTTASLNWQDDDIACMITNHSIIWWWDVLWNDEVGLEETFIALNHINLTNLSPYTNVTAGVAAATDSGYGAPTTCWGLTLQDIPGAPAITTIKLTEHSIYVTWSPPEEANGQILGYSVNIINEIRNITLYTDGMYNNAVIFDIQQNQSYKITVEAATEAGWGLPSDAVTIYTAGNEMLRKS